MQIFLVAIFLTLNTAVWSQNIYGSPYSVYGLGIANNRLSTLNRGMGGTGIAVRDDFNLNYTNPASYGSISPPASSIFEMGFYIENNLHQTNELSDSKTNGSLSNVNYWFKLKPQWSSMIGLTPYSSVAYKINTTRSLGNHAAVDYAFEGSGTISQFYWGNSFNVIKNLSLGLNISYLFGSISKSESIYADQAGSLIFENKIFTNKVTLDVGAQYEVRLKNDKSLVVGVIADNGTSFRATRQNSKIDRAVWNEGSPGRKKSFGSK